MNYDYDTVDYIFDTFNYAIFQMARNPMDVPMESWDLELMPFSFFRERFAQWLRSEWTLKEEEFESPQNIQKPSYRWTISLDFYRGIPEKTRLIDIDGFYPDSRSAIYFTSQSLFLFEFLKKLSSEFSIINPLYVSVGNDLHIVKYDENTDVLDFLKEIKSHNTRFKSGE